ncbi:hypothetical protein GCM10027589_06050 [Actinocorallia lasiicapitis]
MKRLFAKVAVAGAGTVALLFPATPAQAAGEWHEVALPPLWPTNFINELVAAAPDSVWIGGGQGKFCIPGWTPYSCALSSPGNPVARRWNGTQWLEYPLRDLPAKAGPIDDVGASGSEVWVHSHVLSPEYLARFDGAAFQKMPLPEAGTVSLSVNPAGVWLKGSGRQYRWNGSGWTVTPMPAGIRGISGDVRSVSATEAWGLGVASEGVGYALLRWDGGSWSKAVDLPLNAWEVYSDQLAVTGPGEAWVLNAGTPSGTARVFQWKNGALTDRSPSTPTRLNRLRADGQGTVFASGYVSLSPETQGTLRFTGTGWVAEPPLPDGIYQGSVIGVPGTDRSWTFRGSPAQTFTNS